MPTWDDCDDLIRDSILGSAAFAPLTRHHPRCRCLDWRWRLLVINSGTYEAYCLMNTDYDGGGWTLAIKGTLDGSYNSSKGKLLSDNKDLTPLPTWL